MQRNKKKVVKSEVVPQLNIGKEYVIDVPETWRGRASHTAVLEQNLEELKELCTYFSDSDFGFVDIYGENLFHLCCSTNNFSIFKYLCKVLPPFVTHKLNSKNENAFLIACRYNENLELLERLHTKIKLDIHNISSVGENALHKASYSGNIDKISYLISKGIDPFLLTQKGESCLHIACEFNPNLNVIQYLYQLLKDYSFQYFKTQNGEISNNNNNNNNNQNEEGENVNISSLRTINVQETIFHKACRNRRVEILNFISSINNINIQDVNRLGLNGFLIACQFNDNYYSLRSPNDLHYYVTSNYKIIQFLHTKTDINIHSVCKSNQNALYYAVRNLGRLFKCDYRVIRYLYDIGVELNNELFEYAKTIEISQPFTKIGKYLSVLSRDQVLPLKFDRENVTEWKNLFVSCLSSHPEQLYNIKR